MRDRITQEAAIGLIDTILDEKAAELVEAFYDPAAPKKKYGVESDFIGNAFTEMGKSDPNSFEAADILAVHLMGMSFTPTATSALLEPGSERDGISELLSRIPDVDIWSERANFTAANKLWSILCEERKTVYRGIAWVTAGKLLARKRPGLIPIVDKVVTDLVPEPLGGYWELFRSYLKNEDRRKRVDALRPDTALEETPTLRLLDTVIWMRGSRGPASEIRQQLMLDDRR